MFPQVRKCIDLPEHLRSEITFLRTRNIPNFILYTHRVTLSKRFTGCVSTSGSQTHCSEGQIRTYKATRGTHCDADATMSVPEPCEKLLIHFLFPAKCIVSYRQIISSRLYVRLKETCSLAGGALLHIGE